VHNDIRSGDELEILRPPYDIIKVRPRKIWNAKTGEEMKEAHGGGSRHVIYINCKEEIPGFSVVRKKNQKSKIKNQNDPVKLRNGAGGEKSKKN
jgi:hypothetical protein